MIDLVPSIPIQLDRERSLRYDINAAIAFQRAAAGRSIYGALGSIMALFQQRGIELDPETQAPKDPSKVFALLGDLPVEDIRLMLWAGLLKEDPALTPDNVGALIPLSLTALLDLVTQIMNAIAQQGPQAEGGGGTPQNPPAAT